MPVRQPAEIATGETGGISAPTCSTTLKGLNNKHAAFVTKFAPETRKLSGSGLQIFHQKLSVGVLSYHGLSPVVIKIRPLWGPCPSKISIIIFFQRKPEKTFEVLSSRFEQQSLSGLHHQQYGIIKTDIPLVMGTLTGFLSLSMECFNYNNHFLNFHYR